MVQTTQPPRRDAANRDASPPDDGLTDELREELRAMIARRASLYRELEKH